MNEKSGGKIVFILDEYLEKHPELSKNKIVMGAKMQRTQFQNYYKNKVVRVDLAVLARMCDYLKCDLHDIIKYIP